MKKSIIIVLVMSVAMIALPIKAQGFGSSQLVFGEQPTVYSQPAFRSTSTLAPSGSKYSSIIEAGTTVDQESTYPAYRPGGPRKANAITGEENGDMPVGDAVLPLMLMAIGYVVWKRRRREERGISSL